MSTHRIDFQSSNRRNRHLSPLELAEKQIAECDAEAVRRYAVLYAKEQNERVRRDWTLDAERRSALPVSPVRLAAQSAARARADARTAAAAEYVASVAKNFTLKLSADLLNSKMIVRGAGIAWGEATVRDFEDRRKDLLGKLSADADTIAKLDVAIAALRESGAKTLGDLAKQGVKVIGETTREAVAV